MIPNYQFSIIQLQSIQSTPRIVLARRALEDGGKELVQAEPAQRLQPVVVGRRVGVGRKAELVDK